MTFHQRSHSRVGPRKADREWLCEKNWTFLDPRFWRRLAKFGYSFGESHSRCVGAQIGGYAIASRMVLSGGTLDL